jgi:hypothetical protein
MYHVYPSVSGWLCNLYLGGITGTQHLYVIMEQKMYSTLRWGGNVCIFFHEYTTNNGALCMRAKYENKKFDCKNNKNCKITQKHVYIEYMFF